MYPQAVGVECQCCMPNRETQFEQAGPPQCIEASVPLIPEAETAVKVTTFSIVD